ncbi:MULTISPECIES: hypothetical protein [unclassified Streptomyces]|uniref:hypothetical protein n=1 Tax=unclassified Streptomyces TaxID=2593676 RepID=UPI002DD872AD|nr:hypothetical protein [Streptomyces sp. NBC_01445]WSE07037.1 hypothetical protein OG574_29120 [Streptomyces sp. NBC_01445]
MTGPKSLETFETMLRRAGRRAGTSGQGGGNRKVPLLTKVGSGASVVNPHFFLPMKRTLVAKRFLPMTSPMTGSTTSQIPGPMTPSARPDDRSERV